MGLAGLARYRKFLAALVGAGVTIAAVYLAPDSPWLPVITSLGTALGVYRLPNTPPAGD